MITVFCFAQKNVRINIHNTYFVTKIFVDNEINLNLKLLLKIKKLLKYLHLTPLQNSHKNREHRFFFFLLSLKTSYPELAILLV